VRVLPDAPARAAGAVRLMEGQRDSLAIDGRIAVLAEAQHGVVSRRQLLIAGLGAGGIEFRLRVGRLHRLHRGV
jgi:hypothetical protein